MPTKPELDKAYLNIACEWSSLSKDTRRKNGCIIVKGGRIISSGYNGTPSGYDNDCQNENGYTKEEVIHAEANAILWLARTVGGSEGATMYCTTAPCINCSKMIIQAGIAEVIYRFSYRETIGIDLLTEMGIKTTQVYTTNIMEDKNAQNK